MHNSARADWRVKDGPPSDELGNECGDHRFEGWVLLEIARSLECEADRAQVGHFDYYFVGAFGVDGK